MLCLVDLDDQVPRDHPIREIKKLTDEALRPLSGTFNRMYARRGRPSVAPERLLKGMLLMALFSVPSERRLCERIRYDLLFRWFLDMDLTERPFDHCAFSDNRERLMKHEVAHKFFSEVFAIAEDRGLTSSDHFSVDGSLIEAWSSMKSFRPKDEDDDDQDSNRWQDFRGKKRSNQTHESKTDPESKLMRKGLGKEAKLSFGAHALVENRNGLLVDVEVCELIEVSETEAALRMLSRLPPSSRRRTVAADKGYDNRAFVSGCRELNLTPHVAQVVKGNGRRGSAIDGRTTRHPGYGISQVIRRRIEQVFGWTKTVGGLRRTRYRGVARTDFLSVITGAAYNLLRISKLLRAAG